MRNLKIILAYDGAGFMGWQIQPGVRTVQETLESALEKILGHTVRVHASGRTDTGVHALGQVVHVHTSSPIPTSGLMRALNSKLPGEISILSVEDVDLNFHARFMAKSKKYVYIIDTTPTFSPFLTRYAVHVKEALDISAMKQSASYLKGEHDFTSFMGAGSSVKTTQRRILESEVFSHGEKVFFYIHGSGFLRHMVRNIAGTLLLIGNGTLPPEEMVEILEKKDRACAGPTAPPQGLYLVGVDYEQGQETGALSRDSADEK